MKYMVLYTDGSARPNPGRTGYGVHGYIGEEGSFKTIDNKWTMTTTGYVPKKDKSKYVELKPDYIIERYGRYEDSDTNNKAELDAAIEALKIAKERLTENDKLHIIADSEYVVRFINNTINGKEGNYNSNQEYLKTLKELVENLDFNFTIERVDGHAGILGNEEADTLSNIGRNLKNKDINNRHVYKDLIIDPIEYWFYEPVINEFLKKNKKLLITLKNDTILNNENLHCITNYKRKNIDEIGKKDPEIQYSVINSKDNVNEINIVTNIIKDGTDILKPFAINLAELLNKKIARKLNLYKEDYLIKKKVMFEIIETTDSNPIVVAVEIFPVSLSWYTVGHFKELYRIKKEYDSGDKKIKTIDIKDLVFENIKESKFYIETDTFKVPLIFRVNIPEPSLFTKLKKEIKKIEFIYKENKDVIYDTSIYIETINGEWEIETVQFTKIRFKKKKDK